MISLSENVLKISLQCTLNITNWNSEKSVNNDKNYKSKYKVQ